MEADNGNVWYDPAAQVLHAVLATQSPHEVATTAAAMVTKSTFGLKAVDLKAGHTVAFGTKDKVIFPYFCVIAGLYGDGLPVRLANDRFEQFQMGMKRHAFWLKDTLVVDRQDPQVPAHEGRVQVRRRRPPEPLIRRGHGRHDGSAVDLLPAEERSCGHRACIACRRGRLDARLRNTADDVGDRDARR
jgi:hypothetical protein